MATPNHSADPLRRHARQQEVLADLSQLALSSPDLDDLFDEAAAGVRTALGAEFGAVFERTADGDALALRSGSGWNAGAEGTVLPATDSPVGGAAGDTEPVVDDDLGTRPRRSRPRLFVEHGVESGISVGVGCPNEPWGVLGVYATATEAFADHDTTFVANVANVLTSAIENARTRRRLRIEETVKERIVETSPIGIVQLNAAGEIEFANDRAAEILGRDRSRLESMSNDDVDWGFVDADGEPLSVADLPSERVLRDGNGVFGVDIGVRSGVGERIWLSVNGNPLREGSEGVTGAVLAFEDITERKRLEGELERYREYTDDVLDAIDDVFYVVDESGELLRWNESATDVTGYSDAETESMNALDFFDEEDAASIAEAIAEAFETGSARVEAGLRTKAGDRVDYEFVASALENPAGEPVLAGIGRDITDRLERERALEESNERLEQFAYAASHDLQEPLRMISSYLTLVDRRYADALDSDGEEFIAFAVDGAERMQAMIDGLLAYSRVDTRGKPFEPVDLDAVLADVRSDLAVKIEETDAEITVEALPRVYGDAGQLRQLFQNLLDNALTYAGDDPPRITVSAEKRDTTWAISVRDRGIGIDPADHERIFDVFDRLHTREEYDGTGIGLALCKRIVERHGGDVAVDSSPGDGSTFTVTLPTPPDNK